MFYSLFLNYILKTMNCFYPIISFYYCHCSVRFGLEYGQSSIKIFLPVFTYFYRIWFCFSDKANDTLEIDDEFI